MKEFFNKLKNINETLIAGVVLLVLFIPLAFYSSKNDDSFGFKCPSDFQEPEEYINSVAKWISEYFKKYPEATEEEMMAVRDKLIEKNRCGKAPFVMDESTLYGEANTSIFSSDELGFTFQYPDYLVAKVYPDQPNWVVVLPKSKQVNDKEPMTAIIISEATDSPEMTAEQWLNGSNSGYNVSRDGDYIRGIVGGQDAVIVDNGWVVVKHPDGKRRISIAYLVEQEKGAQPLHQELQGILDTFSFK